MAEYIDGIKVGPNDTFSSIKRRAWNALTSKEKREHAAWSREMLGLAMQGKLANRKCLNE